MDSYLYKTLSRKHSVWLDIDRLYGISNQLGERERATRHEEHSQLYETNLDILKLKARGCRQTSLQIMFAAAASVSVCPFLEEIILELIEHSTTLEDISFWYPSPDVDPQTELEGKILDAVCRNSNIKLKSLDLSTLVHFAHGNNHPRTNQLLHSLEELQFSPLSVDSSYSHSSCEALEEALVDGNNNLNKLVLHGVSGGEEDDERVAAFCQTMERCLPHLTGLKALTCDLVCLPEVARAVVE